MLILFGIYLRMFVGPSAAVQPAHLQDGASAVRNGADLGGAHRVPGQPGQSGSDRGGHLQSAG